MITRGRIETSGFTKNGSRTETGEVSAMSRVQTPKAKATINPSDKPNRIAVMRIGTCAMVMRIMGSVIAPRGVLSITTVKAIIMPTTVSRCAEKDVCERGFVLAVDILFSPYCRSGYCGCGATNFCAHGALS